MRKSNYDKSPFVSVKGNFDVICGWDNIFRHAARQLPEKGTLVIECYHGVARQTMEKVLLSVFHDALIIKSESAFKSTSEIDKLTFPDVTEDRIFGVMTSLRIDRFFNETKLRELRDQIISSGKRVIIYGIGASHIVTRPDLFLYVNMARWEIQQRMRRNELGNVGADNTDLEIARKYKRAYFVDWRICDLIKRETFDHWHYVIDANEKNDPKMIDSNAYRSGLDQVVSRPFRLTPLFDPGPWGGQWMKEVCDLDRSAINYAWCFDCVPEENSLHLRFNDVTLEFPSIDLVFFRPEKLLGKKIVNLFGAEFPIRFDFLDTMDGGNLSLQVHPLTEYIKKEFGMAYTQDESYYLLDAKEGAYVYLGLREDVEPERMMAELRAAQNGEIHFNADKHVKKWPAKKHDHFLIPAGTVHCSGADSMVLEISATPYIFTFKLWDWGRLGLDGLPRPINIERGEHSIQWNRREKWTADNLINQVEQLESGKGWRAEKTGLHSSEFIETIRHWFTAKTHHQTQANLNVLNLVEGEEVVVESPEGAFEPFHVHYAETFIVPASVNEYTIRPVARNTEKEHGTIKAFVR